MTSIGSAGTKKNNKRKVFKEVITWYPTLPPSWVRYQLVANPGGLGSYTASEWDYEPLSWFLFHDATSQSKRNCFLRKTRVFLSSRNSCNGFEFSYENPFEGTANDKSINFGDINYGDPIDVDIDGPGGERVVEVACQHSRDGTQTCLVVSV